MLLAKDSCLAKEKKRKRLPTTPSGVLYYFRNYVRLSYLKTELKTSAFLQWLGSQPKNKQTNKPTPFSQLQPCYQGSYQNLLWVRLYGL